MTNKITLLKSHQWDSEHAVTDLVSLAYVAVNKDWSHAIFKNKERKKENFLYSHYIVVDIDEGMSLQDAVKTAVNLNNSFIVLLSRNHQKEKNGVVCDRFRIVFELSYPITDVGQFIATVESLRVSFPTMDFGASSNPAGQWFKASAIGEHYNLPNKLVPAPIANVPKQKPKEIQVVTKNPQSPSKTTVKFVSMVNELTGKRWEPFRKAAIDLKQQGFSIEQARNFLTSIHSDWFTDEYDSKLYSIYNNVEPKYPARLDGEFDEAELERWTKEWIIANGLECTFSGVLSINGLYYSFNDICRKMRIDRDRAGAKIYEDKIKDYLEEWISLARSQHLKNVVKRITPYAGPVAEEEFNKFCKALVHNVTDIDRVVIKHFIWQVKQKMLGRTPTYHMMPVFYGPQGSGKTTALMKLLSPLGELVSSPNGFNFVKDYREIHVFKDNFVIFSDEMAQADKADVNLLKNLISSAFVESRVMKSHSRERYANNATLIGATNRPLKDVIMDDTGARRFFQLNCPSKMEFDAINSIDYGLVWGAVDPDAEAPIKAVWQEVSKKQEEEFRTKGPIELWMEEQGYEIDNEGDGIQTNKAFKDFKEWDGGFWNPTSFGRALSRIGVKRFKKQTNGARDWSYGLKKIGEIDDEF